MQQTMYLGALLLAMSSSLQVFSAATADAEQVQRFEVDGENLYFDLDIQYYEDDWSGSEPRNDYKIMSSLLYKNPQITSVILTGSGGNAFQSLQIARALSLREKFTVAHGECLSACAIIFLGGAKRTLADGAVLGFHRSNWDVDEAADVYNFERKRMGWMDEFDFAVWLHKNAQIDAKDVLELAIDQGVDPQAVVKMLTADADDMWRPDQKLLAHYRIITEE